MKKFAKYNYFSPFVFISILLLSVNSFCLEQKNYSLSDMKTIVEKASARVSKWDGPTTGAKAQTGKNIIIVCEDLRNGGVLGVTEGIEEATKVLQWKIKILDAKGTKQGRIDKLKEALKLKPDGVILVGSDANSLNSQLNSFKKENIPIVGWHTGSVAGKLTSGNIAVNVSTDPLEVAKITAMAAIVESNGTAGVVIFTDSNFEIAMKKANAMANLIKTCNSCMLLEIKDLAISESSKVVPKETEALIEKYDDNWTHALAINDIYFDYATPRLIKSGKDIHLYSAGDGSSAAFLRIHAGAFQYGTVAEPLTLQGWQLADELNRLLAGQDVSGYIIPVHLVTNQNVSFDGGEQMIFNPDNNYKEYYRKIWEK